METAFWFGYRLDNFILKDANISSPLGLIGICTITLAIAFVFEALRTLRDWVYLEFLKKRGPTAGESPIDLVEVKKAHNGTANGRISSEKAESNGSSTSQLASGTPVMGTGNVSSRKRNRPGVSAGLVELCISTVLHVCQVLVGYLLMLVVMTFNVWIFLAVLIGITLGFFFFDGFNRKIHAMKLNTSGK